MPDSPTPNLPPHSEATPPATLPDQTPSLNSVAPAPGPPPQTDNSTSYPTNPDSVTPTPPWARLGPVDIPAPPRSDVLPNSSATSPSQRKPFTSSARIISLGEPQKTRHLIITLATFCLLILPFVLLIGGSYLGWPKYYPLPASVKVTVDRLIALSPLPQTSRIVLSPMLANLQNLTTYQQSLTLNAISTNPHQKLSILVSGPVDLTSTHPHAFYDISATSTISDQVLLLTAKAVQSNGLLELTIDKTAPFENFKFESLLNRPITFAYNPSSSQDLSQQSLTPGKQALTKIRNNKLSKLNQDYLTLILEKSQIDTSPENIQPQHLITTQLTKTEILNYFKEFTTIIQESQPSPTFPQSALQKFYLQLEDIITPLSIKFYIDKSTLNLVMVDFSTRLSTQSLQPNGNGLLAAEKENQSLLVTARYSLTDINLPVTVPSSTPGQPASELDWTAIVTHPLLNPLMPKPKPAFD